MTEINKTDSADLPDINSYRNKIGFICQTAYQIIKDFGEFSMEIHFSGNGETAYEELFGQVHTFISQLLKQNYHRLFSLLYRIDLSEKKIVDAQNRFPDLPKSEIITELILHRELAKVVYRNYYSNKNPNKDENES